MNREITWYKDRAERQLAMHGNRYTKEEYPLKERVKEVPPEKPKRKRKTKKEETTNE